MERLNKIEYKKIIKKVKKRRKTEYKYRRKQRNSEKNVFYELVFRDERAKSNFFDKLKIQRTTNETIECLDLF